MRLLWRLYAAFLVTTLLALATTVWFANHTFRRFYRQQAMVELMAEARALAEDLGAHWAEDGREAAVRWCAVFGRSGRLRATVVLADGTVAADSEHDAFLMENHKSRPEIARALAGEMGEADRFSETARRSMFYVAAPVRSGGRVVAAARIARPVVPLENALRTVGRHAALGGLAAAALFALAALALGQRISGPLNEMRDVAGRLARGDLGARVPVPPDADMAALARALNKMAEQLDRRMETILQQSNEQRAVFASMVEGVLAVDREERVLRLNAAAARLLDLDAERARGRPIQEVVRHIELQRLITNALASEMPVEAEIALYGNEDRFLQLHGTALTDASGAKMGALVVLHDITRLKRLETVRRDFVANVSHELKTPITALQGCVETLLDEPDALPEDTRRFLEMMQRQAVRLQAIVEDLLMLARMEHDAERHCVTVDPGSVREVLRRAVQAFAKPANGKGIALALQCEEELTAPINAPLLEQAVGNLLDNAIKYSESGTRVTVEGAVEGGDIVVRVKDEGPGIERRHLNRIFERFYRVDQARSRALGGTGLGLAIVKHIAAVHGGTVAVESTPGQGSVFSIRLPAPATAAGAPGSPTA